MTVPFHGNNIGALGFRRVHPCVIARRIEEGNQRLAFAQPL